MTKKLLLLSALLLLTSCGGGNSAPEKEVVEDTNPDVTMLFTQTCLNKDSSCKQLVCNKENAAFICTDNPLGDNKNCSEEKSYDDIMNSYKICSDNKELLTYSIFNYSEKKNSIFESMTPNEIETKIAEETKKVEEGGESEWLGTFLAAAGGALIGGAIANMFGGGSAQVPQRPNNIENNQTVNKQSLAQAQADSKTATADREKSRDEKVQKRKSEIEKRKQAAKDSKSNSSTKKKSSSRKKRR